MVETVKTHNYFMKHTHQQIKINIHKQHEEMDQHYMFDLLLCVCDTKIKENKKK